MHFRFAFLFKMGNNFNGINFNIAILFERDFNMFSTSIN
jgi:hypothetical protein